MHRIRWPAGGLSTSSPASVPGYAARAHPRQRHRLLHRRLRGLRLPDRLARCLAGPLLRLLPACRHRGLLRWRPHPARRARCCALPAGGSLNHDAGAGPDHLRDPFQGGVDLVLGVALGIVHRPDHGAGGSGPRDEFGVRLASRFAPFTGVLEATLMIRCCTLRAPSHHWPERPTRFRLLQLPLRARRLLPRPSDASHRCGCRRTDGPAGCRSSVHVGEGQSRDPH